MIARRAAVSDPSRRMVEVISTSEEIADTRQRHAEKQTEDGEADIKQAQTD